MKPIMKDINICADNMPPSDGILLGQSINLAHDLVLHKNSEKLSVNEYEDQLKQLVFKIIPIIHRLKVEYCERKNYMLDNIKEEEQQQQPNVFD